MSQVTLSPPWNWTLRIVFAALILLGFYLIFSNASFVGGLSIIFIVFIVGTLLDASTRESQVMVPLE